MEVSKIINTQYELAKQVLVDHMDVFERVSNILLDVETLDSEEFLAVVNNGATSEQIKEIQAKKTLSGSEGGDNANKQEAQSNAINSLNTTPTPA